MSVNFLQKVKVSVTYFPVTTIKIRKLAVSSVPQPASLHSKTKQAVQQVHRNKHFRAHETGSISLRRRILEENVEVPCRFRPNKLVMLRKIEEANISNVY